MAARRSRTSHASAAALAALVSAAAGCWDDPVRETVTVDLRENGRVGLTVAIELDSLRELEQEPAARRTVELTAADLLEGRNRWNERFAALDCAVESGSWRRELGDLRRYTLEAVCDDPGALGALLGDRQLAVDLSWQHGEGELRLVPNGGGGANRSERQRLERDLDRFVADFERYVESTLPVARRAARETERAEAIWTAVLLEGDSEAKNGDAPLLTAVERPEVERLLEAMTELLGAFTRREGEPESLDALARRVFDPFPRRLEVLVPPRHELAVEGFVPAGADRFELPPRGLDGALVALEGRWLEPDPVLAMLRQLRSDDSKEPDLQPFLRGSIVRSGAPVDASALRREIGASLAPADEYRIVWRRRPARE